MKNKSLPKIMVVAFREFWVTLRTKGYLITTFGMPVFISLYIGIAIIPSILMEKKEEEKRIVALVDLAGVVDFEAITHVSKMSESAEQLARDLGAPVPPSFEEMKEAAEEAKAFEENADESPGFEDPLENNLEGDAAVTPAPPPGTIQITRYETAEAARAALDDGTVFSYIVIPEDYMETGHIDSYAKDSGVFGSSGWKYGMLRKGIYSGLFKKQIDPALFERLLSPVNLTEHNISDTGETKETSKLDEAMKFALPGGFMVLLMMSLMMGGGFLITGTAEEKENRVMEILLSSATPEQFFWGKLFGLGTAGFMQFVIWLTIAVVPVGFIFMIVEIPLGLVALALLYYIFGFFMFGSLMLGSGSLGTNQRESQQLSMVWSMMNVIPMIGMVLIVGEPNGLFARIISYFPLTSPVGTVARLATGKMPWWEVPLTLGILALSTWLAIRFSAKLFRLGILMYGKRPSFKEIFRWLREA